MSKTPSQKYAAELWRREQQEAEWTDESRHKACYLVKYLRDIGDTKNEVAELKLKEIRRLADEMYNALQHI